MADRYWRGGTGTWNASNTTNWSTTSGGAGGASVPTSADDVFFDANSGSGTVTVGATVNCANLNFTGYTGTFTGSSPINCHGSLTAVAGMTWTNTSAITFLASSGSRTLTSAGKTFGRFDFNCPGATYTLQDNLATSAGTAESIRLIQGTLDFNDFNVTYSSYLATAGSGTKVLNAGTGTLTGSGISVSNASNQTLNTSASTLVVNTSGTATNPFALIDPPVGGSLTFANITITGGRTTTTPYQDPVYVYATVTVTGDFTATGSAQRPLTLFGRRGVSTINVTGTVALTDVNLHHMTCGGTWAGTRVGDAGGNTGSITFDAPRDLYWIGNGGNWQDNSKWSTSSGGASATTYPLPQDICHFDANSFSTTGQTVTLNNSWVSAMDWTGVTNTPTVTYTSSSVLFCGSEYIMNGGVTGTTTQYLQLSTPSGGTMTITSNGFEWGSFADDYIEINNGQYQGDIGGTIVFADDFNAPSTYLYADTAGNLTVNNGMTVTLGTFDVNAGFISGNSVYTVNGNLSVSSLFRVVPRLAAVSTTLFSGTGAITLTGSATFNASASLTNIINTPVVVAPGATVAYTRGNINSLTKAAGATSSVTFANPATINTLTVDTATLQSSVSGTPRTLTIGSADIKRATISDITVAPQVIKAKNSVDAGGNTNINFVDVPANLATTVVTPTNRTTTPSAIINSTTTNVTIHGT